MDTVLQKHFVHMNILLNPAPTPVRYFRETTHMGLARVPSSPRSHDFPSSLGSRSGQGKFVTPKIFDESSSKNKPPFNPH
jgi:hypothetical protein